MFACRFVRPNCLRVTETTKYQINNIDNTKDVAAIVRIRQSLTTALLVWNPLYDPGKK
jgi:hypothetical protein